MLTEVTGYGCKTEEDVKVIQSEIKKNIQGTNSDRKETGTQINNLEQKEDIYIQPEKNEETRIQKNEERLRNLWNDSKYSNIQMQSKIKENVQGTNSEGKETGLKSMIWSRRKKETFKQNRMKTQEFRKMKRGLGTSRTSLNVPTSEL